MLACGDFQMVRLRIPFESGLIAENSEYALLSAIGSRDLRSISELLPFEGGILVNGVCALHTAAQEGRYFATLLAEFEGGIRDFLGQTASFYAM